MFDPATNIAGLLGMAFDVIGTTITAFFLPVVQLMVLPLAAILQWFSQR